MNNQISHYKSAVGHRNVGSDASPSAMRNATRTALGQNRSSSVTSNNVAAPTHAPKPKGSWEGYMHAPSAPIQMSGTGYLAKGAQKARVPRTGTDLASSMPTSLNLNTRASSRPFNYTHCSSKNNSAYLLRQHMELNNLF